jgi:hypothetical protein
MGILLPFEHKYNNNNNKYFAYEVPDKPHILDF